MTLFDDATGSLGATMVSLPFLWKEVGNDKIEITFVDPESGKLAQEKRMELVITYPDNHGDEFMLKALDADQTFYRIPSEKE